MSSAEGRAWYPMILEDDWLALGYVGLPVTQLGRGLDGPIHDVFRYRIPGRSAPIWTKQSLGQYKAIHTLLAPVFRLATKILLCPASLDWFYYLIYAPRKLTEPPIQHKGEDVHRYRRDDTTINKRHEMARAALQRLAMIHTIEFEDNPIDGGTWPTMEAVNVKDDSSPTKSGVGPKITISRDYCRLFMQFCMEGDGSLDRMYTLAVQMAIIWIHELAHGAGMASSLRLLGDARKEELYRAHAAANPYQREPKVPDLNEDLFENENLAEPGYSWENFIFGGTIELHEHNPEHPLLVVEWPSFLKGVEHLRIGGWKRSATLYIVPKAWVINLNTQKFWNNVGNEDNTALYIKKIVGFRKSHTLTGIDDDGNASESSEGKWPTDAQRSQGQSKSTRVSRIRPGTIIEDPSGAGANELAW